MYPILIIQTNYKTVVYIQNQKQIDKRQLLPVDWIQLGISLIQMGILDFNSQVKLLYITDNEVNNVDILKNFSDRVEHLHQEIITIVSGGSNVIVDSDKEVIDITFNNSIVKTNTSRKINRINRYKKHRKYYRK